MDRSFVRAACFLLVAMVVFMSACSSASAPAGDPNPITFAIDTQIAAGTEAQRCLYVTMPTNRGDTIAIGSADSTFTAGSHHFLVFRTDLTEIPAGGSDLFDCFDSAFIAHVVGSFYEAQSPKENRALPMGVAQKFRAGEVLLLQTHYLNVTAAAVNAHVELHMHQVPTDSVKEEASSVFFYNPKIHLPPHSTTTVTLTCPVSNDMQLALLWSHMHKQGIHFRATSTDPLMPVLYESDGWSEPKAKDFSADPNAIVHGGSSITVECTYQNGTENDIVQGPSAETNEMCILHGSYWPQGSLLQNLCVFGKTDGAGTKSARETVGCLSACGTNASCAGACWDNICPNSAAAVFAIGGCIQSTDKCHDDCSADPTTAACETCMQSKCAGTYALYDASKC